MSVYSIYRITYIQLNEYWIKMYGLDINKKYYISIDNWLELMQQEIITINDMNNIIKDLHLEKEVSVMNEENKKCKDEDEDEDEDVEETLNLARNKWIQRQQFFDYCLQDFKKGLQWDTATSSLIVELTPQSSVKSVGKIIPTEIMDEIMDEIIDDSLWQINTYKIS